MNGQSVVPELGAEFLFLQTDGSEGKKFFNEISESALWKNVAAVKNNNVFAPEYWIYLSWGALGREMIVDQLIEYLKKP